MQDPGHPFNQLQALLMDRNGDIRPEANGIEPGGLNGQFGSFQFEVLLEPPPQLSTNTPFSFVVAINGIGDPNSEEARPNDLWALASLLQAGAGPDDSTPTAGLRGRLVESPHAFQPSEAVGENQSPQESGDALQGSYFLFDSLAFVREGIFRIRISLVQMESSNASSMISVSGGFCIGVIQTRPIEIMDEGEYWTPQSRGMSYLS
ncbi:MAG: hypothetical protein M1814_005167 [Vezdaea aestivalis]|nr:MAG: hypothetical protein M1814_005167 [Vezdaea aestivalis]